MRDLGSSFVSLPPPCVSFALSLSCLKTKKWLEWLQRYQETAMLRDRKGLDLPGPPSVAWTKIFLDPPPVKSPWLGLATRTSYQLQFTFGAGDEEKGWTPKQLQGWILTDSMLFAHGSHDTLLLVPEPQFWQLFLLLLHPSLVHRNQLCCHKTLKCILKIHSVAETWSMCTSQADNVIILFLFHPE